MNFINTITAYKNSERLIKHGAFGHPVIFPELAKYDNARRQLAIKITESALHPDWQEGLKIFNIIHAKLARTPCSPKWLIQEIRQTQASTFSKLNARVPNVESDVSKLYTELTDHLENLSRIQDSPLIEPLTKIADSRGKTLFVLRDKSLWEETRRHLANVMGAQRWEIVKPSSLRNQQHADQLFIFGPVWCLRYRQEEFLLRAPVAPRIHIIACAHEFTGDVKVSLLDEGNTIRVSGRNVGEPNEMPLDFETIAPIQCGRFRLKGSSESKFWESGKKVKAFPFRVGGSHGAYFAIDSSVWVVTADRSGSSPVCTGVDKVPVDDLEPGAMILMTTSSGGDMIPLVADIILERSRQVRELQLSWKVALRARVEEEGIETTSKNLVVLGAQKASHSNLKNWCNPRSIGMEKLDTDLHAVLKLIGMEDSYMDVFSGIEALRRAHQSAGKQLHTKLRESLLGRDLSEVLRHGELVIRQPGGPAKTVFLVEERGEEVEIPEEWEGELREIDD